MCPLLKHVDGEIRDALTDGVLGGEQATLRQARLAYPWRRICYHCSAHDCNAPITRANPFSVRLDYPPAANGRHVPSRSCSPRLALPGFMVEVAGCLTESSRGREIGIEIDEPATSYCARHHRCR